MKVLCLHPTGLQKIGEFSIEFGEIYTVLDTAHMGDSHEFCYLVHETERFKYWYSAWRFAPLSNIDEKEIIKQREETYA